MATEHTKHQVESEERQDVVKDLTRVIYYCWPIIIVTSTGETYIYAIFTMTNLSLVCVLYTCTIVLMRRLRKLPHIHCKKEIGGMVHYNGYAHAQSSMGGAGSRRRIRSLVPRLSLGTRLDPDVFWIPSRG